ncbi:hypothetical protein SCLCIDRAFT_1067704 [Scleroderma citrinum Foug A]|uniref:Uncharacterized protein n=1 Tax=Scleroderma citrinum Foug A TaxID=1036808 RepID=A0A0C3EIK4_9AGAM|nr:hypothetical protein SCLCIDRAFT_1067704 [Scleroderma citrinum Foug A]
MGTCGIAYTYTFQLTVSLSLCIASVSILNGLVNCYKALHYLVKIYWTVSGYRKISLCVATVQSNIMNRFTGISMYVCSVLPGMPTRSCRDSANCL